MNAFTRFKTFGKSTRGGILILLLGILTTVVWVQVQGRTFTSTSHVNGTGGQISVHPRTGVEFQASLSNPMVVQGHDGTVYLNLSVTTPRTVYRDILRVPTDLIVVLDRSGSMGEDNKWHYATQAVHSVLDRLGIDDRIALVTFDSTAQVQSQLVAASEGNIQRFRSIVNSLRPGASTNLGEGLLRAEELASKTMAAKRRGRVLLLSDGHANAGIVAPSQLGAMVRRISNQGAVVSTIGMGLGFNETLMASLADHGMGSFSFLEHLESLGTILARELSDSRDLYADASEVRIDLPSGVELIDAAGYPFVLEGQTAVIRTGQLIQDSVKSFMATLRIPNHMAAEYTFGNIDLSYRVDGSSYRQEVESSGLTMACVVPERQEEAVASINKELYEDAWIKNNLGSVMKDVADFVRSGEREKAEEVVQSYRKRLEDADANVPGLTRQAGRELDELEARVDDAFDGPDQKIKQNRAAKSMLGDSQELQRQTDRNNK
jgi:Ca-activated chloride channel family protein